MRREHRKGSGPGRPYRPVDRAGAVMPHEARVASTDDSGASDLVGDCCVAQVSNEMYARGGHIGEMRRETLGGCLWSVQGRTAQLAYCRQGGLRRNGYVPASGISAVAGYSNLV